jgi:hypothetical protein
MRAGLIAGDALLLTTALTLATAYSGVHIDF